MFTNDPSNPLDRIRMTVGDTDEDNEYISDGWYYYYLTANSNNETLTAIEVAKKILSKFTSNTREKVDQVEIYGNEQFNNYLKWLKEFIESPSLSGLRSPVPYASGISKSDMRKNDADSDNVRPPIKAGFTQDSEPKYITNYWYFE